MADDDSEPAGADHFGHQHEPVAHEHHHLLHSFAGVMLVAAMFGATVGPSALEVAAAPKITEVARIEDDLPDEPEDEEPEDEEPPLDIEDLVNRVGSQYGVAATLVASREALAQWEAGLVDPQTHVEFMHLLQSLVASAAREAGVSPQSFDAPSRSGINGVTMSTITPDEAWQLVAGEGSAPETWQHLVLMAAEAGEPVDGAVGEVALADEQARADDVDAQKTVTEDELAEVLMQLLEEKGEPGSAWAEAAGQLKPSELAGDLIAAFIAVWAKSFVEWSHKRVRDLLRLILSPEAQDAHVVDEGTLSLTISDAHGAVTKLVISHAPGSEVGSEPGKAPKLEVAAVRKLAVSHDAHPETSDLLRGGIAAGMEQGLREAGAPAAAEISAAVSSFSERLVDGAVL